MEESFDSREFAVYVGKNWRMLVICCGVAVTLATAASLLLPKRYTATASLLIEPPAGNDPRAVTAVSPVYLESLKTFERIVASDSVFLQALERLHIPEGRSGRSVESLKHEILEVSKPTNTSILEIRATLRDPRQAQALVQYLAEHTAALRHALDESSEEDVTEDVLRTLATAQSRTERAQAARDAFTAAEPIEALDDDVANTGEVIYRLRRDLSTARAQVAELEAQRRQPAADAAATDDDSVAGMITAARARVRQFEQQEKELTAKVNAEGKVLEARKNRREKLEAELSAARGEYEAAKTKLSDIRSSAMFRGERLQVIDPGIIPRQPSSPNLPLNLLIALVFSLVGSVVYLAIRFTYGRVPLAANRAYTMRHPA